MSVRCFAEPRDAERSHAVPSGAKPKERTRNGRHFEGLSR